ncbi:MAG: molybdopterin dinucleotide binding domain-containing protein, partial [Armatimonadota bacterium]
RWVGVYVLPSGANTFGTLDMLASGGPPEGMAALEMIGPGSGLRGLVTIGEHLGRLLGPPDLAKLRERLEVAVSLASFASPATELADVALPVQMTGERGGAIRRPDGRLWWSQPVLKRAGKSRTITSVLDSLAAALGEDSRWDDLEGLWAQMRSAAAGYSHVSLADLQAGELPAVGMDAPRVGDVVGVGVLQDPPVAVREPTEDRPFLLIPRSTRGGWTTDPRCQAAHILRREATLYREPYVLVAPQDLEELAVREGGRVQVATASGAAEVRARADSGTPPKLAVLPTEFPGLVRTLAGPGGRRAEDGRLPANPVAGSIRPADRR